MFKYSYVILVYLLGIDCAIIEVIHFIYKEGLITMKIMVTGIGGVGGYLASVLCANYHDVTLIARRKRKESLITNGLVTHSDFFGEHTAHPTVIDDPASAGLQDIIFVCVKNYSLEAALTAALPCIGEETIVVPVLNGFTYHDEAARLMKKGKIVDSAIYITSSYEEDYSIRQEGKFARIYIGSDDKDAVQKVYDVLNHPGLTCCKAENIQVEIWRKFILNCAYNVLTAYYMTSIGGALSQPHGKEEFKALLQEAYNVGKAAGVPLPDDVVEDQYQRIVKSDDMDATSSLKWDLAAGHQSELDTFSGALIRLAKQCGVPVPVSEKCYAALKQRT